MTSAQIIGLVGGIIGILSPIIMFLVAQLRKTDKELSAKDIELLKVMVDIVVRDTDKLKETTDSLTKDQYRLLD